MVSDNMERINEIASVQALSSLNGPLEPEIQFQLMQLQMQLQQIPPSPQQQQQHQQQRHQQQQQQQQQQRQQQLEQEIRQYHQNQIQLQTQTAPARSRLHQQVRNSNGNDNQNHQPGHRGHRNSSTASTLNGRNGRLNNNSNNTHHQNNTDKELIDLVTCKLCKGYLIDAVTIDLCMHSFCRPCAIKFIRERPRCPECNLEIKDKRFLNRLKTDVTMQNIVYKLVPGLYENEMARRRKFYAARPTSTPRYKSEMFGDIPPSKTIKPDDMINVSITWNRENQDDEPIKTYLLCRADSTILVLKKLIIGKFGLERPIKIYYGNWEIFYDLSTLMDVAATFNWAPESKVMGLHFKKQDDSGENERSVQTNGDSTQINSSPLKNSAPDLLNGP